MKRYLRFLVLLAGVVWWLAGCTPGPGGQPSPTSVAAPAPLPKATSTPVPTDPPYTGRPFRILFLHAGSLWLYEAGGSRQPLSAEPPGWTVSEYAASPDGKSAAYIALRDGGRDGVVRLLRLADGSTRDLVGRGDAYLETGLRWLDEGHLAYVRERRVVGESAAVFEADTLANHRVLDLAGGEDKAVPESVDLSQSPDGRYWATCVISYEIEGNCRYSLQERATGAQWPLVSHKVGGGLLGWSADSAYLYFLVQFGPPAIYPQVLLVNAATRTERLLSLADKIALAAAWAPSRDEIAFVECPTGASSGSQGCLLRFSSPAGLETAPAIRLAARISPNRLAWTPDGERLVLAGVGGAVWSLRRDGSDLRLLVEDAQQVSVLNSREN